MPMVLDQLWYILEGHESMVGCCISKGHGW
jgi:hypothetical protein